MSTLTRIMIDFYRMNNSLKSTINSVLHEEGVSLLRDFRERAPVDSGLYRSNWTMLKGRFSSSSTISSVTLSNKTPHAVLMEEGAEKNTLPWNYPASKARTGRLVYSNGRVWAGGWTPGHQKTIGGAIGPVLVNNNSRLTQITDKIADSVIEGFR